ncbi:MAG: hypothetical protein C5B53_11245 [Candidatus Melainabacteria bacterium]|nr:MAG: hypothetical protein C5B53_11245 [Candidatus Melainabacteria bacterium]
MSLPLTILITNNTLGAPAGTETYVRDLAVGLLKRGHKPIVYSTNLGTIADQLRLATVPVVDDLKKIACAPDLIHGHHHLDTMAALLRFPNVPAIYYCHGWLPFEEMPFQFPRVLHYIAVDHTCFDRLVFEHGVPKERITILLNFIDLQRFPKKQTPLPEQPRKGLIFSNYASESTHVPMVRRACEKAGIELDIVGQASFTHSNHPESLLHQYDIIFAKAKSALEAMSVGSAVVLCDSMGLGPLVTSENFQDLRQLNFGIRSLNQPLEAELIYQEISRYDAIDAERVSKLVRASASHELVIEKLITIYQSVIDQYAKAGPATAGDEYQAMIEYLLSMKSRLSELDTYRSQCEIHKRHLDAVLASAKVQIEQLNFQLQNSEQQLETVHSELGKMRAKRDELQAQDNRLSLELERVHKANKTLMSEVREARVQTAELLKQQEKSRQQLAEALNKTSALENSITMRLKDRINRIPLVRKVSLAIIKSFSR